MPDENGQGGDKIEEVSGMSGIKLFCRKVFVREVS